jgi:hypothetical protein
MSEYSPWFSRNLTQIGGKGEPCHHGIIEKRFSFRRIGRFEMKYGFDKSQDNEYDEMYSNEGNQRIIALT